MAMKVTVRGGRETAQALQQLGRYTAQARVLSQALRPGARAMVLLARRRAPKDTGEYARSIAVGIRRTGRAAAHLVVGVRGRRRRISHILEFGTRFVAARPHMRPAAQEGSYPAIQQFGVTIWPLIAKEATRVAVRKSVRGR